MIPKEVVGLYPKPPLISLELQGRSNFPFSSSYLLDCSAETDSWLLGNHYSLQLVTSASLHCSRIQVSHETCHCLLGIINEHWSVSSAPPGQVLAGHEQQADSLGRLGGSWCRVKHCWGELAGSQGCTESMSAVGWVRRATVPLLCPDFISLPLKAAPSVTPNRTIHLPVSQFQVLSTVCV